MPASLLTTTISDGSDVCRLHTPALRESMFLLEGYRASSLRDTYSVIDHINIRLRYLDNTLRPLLFCHCTPRHFFFSHVSFVRSHPISLLGFHHVPFGASFARYLSPHTSHLPPFAG